MSFPTGFPNPNGHVPVGTGQQVPTMYVFPHHPHHPHQPVVVVYQQPQPQTFIIQGQPARQVPHNAYNDMRARGTQQQHHPVHPQMHGTQHNGVNRGRF